MHFLLFGVVLLANPALAARGNHDIFPCPPQNISITDQWYMPPTVMTKNPNCTYNMILQFIFPSDYFAIAEVSITSFGSLDVVFMENDFEDQVWMDYDFCGGVCHSFNTTSLWPNIFNLRVQAAENSKMALEIRITLQKATPNANVVQTITTKENSPSTLIYFNEWQEGSSYTFISESSKLDFKVAAVVPAGDDVLFTPLQNIFVYDGDKIAGTLEHVNYQQKDEDYVSDTNNITLFLAKKVNIRGAVFVTDRTNTEGLAQHEIQYVPVDQKTRTTIAEVPGYGHQGGAVTIVGDKDGSTPIDVRQLNNGGNGGEFSYLVGGPLASKAGAVEFKSRNLPLHLGGNMNTFYISKGLGHLKYTTTGN